VRQLPVAFLRFGCKPPSFSLHHLALQLSEHLEELPKGHREGVSALDVASPRDVRSGEAFSSARDAADENASTMTRLNRVAAESLSKRVEDAQRGAGAGSSR
jgi:hypothetical protein